MIEQAEHGGLRPGASAPVGPQLSAVVPVYNEEAGLAQLMSRLIPACRDQFGDDFEIVLVNDGSSDASWGIICRYADEDPRVVGVNLSRNHGHQLALAAGMEVARGAYVFVLDADLQDPPELLGEMLARSRDGFDVVYGQRVARAGETAFKRGSAALFYRVLDRLVDTHVPPDTGDFRLMTRRVVDQLNAMPERYRFVRGMVSWIGFRQTAVRYDRDPRFAGETNYPLRKMVALAVDAVTSFSTVPLRFASYLGMVFGCLGIVALGWVGWSWLRGGTIAGWTSLAALILIIGSVQLLVLGVFGEYLGRMYMEAKRRPLFIVQELRRAQPGTRIPAIESFGRDAAPSPAAPEPAEFDSVAGTYDAQHASSIRLSGEDPAYFSEYKVADMRRALDAAGHRARRVLDFGAGIGNAVPFIQAQFPEAELTCLDVSAASLALCKQRATAPARFVTYDGTRIPFDDGSFDVVFTACVFHHIAPDDHVALLREIRRVLTPNGRFFLFEHNPWNPLTLHAVNTCEFDADAILISAPEMRRRLKLAGFAKMERAYRIFFPGPLAALRPIERLFTWLPLGAQYSLTAC